MTKKTVYIVDDERDIGELLQCFLSPAFTCKVENDPEVALEHLKTNKYDIIVTDFKLNATTGVDLLQMAHKINPSCHKFLMTGAYIRDEYLKKVCNFPVILLSKPFQDPDKLTELIEKTIGGDS